MITLIEALNYRCLRYVRQPLTPFHVLVGPHASGKTTFLDVVGFLARLLSDGVAEAVEERTLNFKDLVWNREGQAFELAIELDIPQDLQNGLPRGYTQIRYEVRVGIHADTSCPRKATRSRNAVLPLAFGPTRAWKGQSGCRMYRRHR